MVIEQRFGRAYRDGDLVAGRVQVTIDRDDRLGLAPRERRRYVAARFQDRVHPELRAELAELARSRGAAGRRVAESLAPLAIVVDDPRHGRERIVGRLQPPQVRSGDLRDVGVRRPRTGLVTDGPPRRLSRDEVVALKFAAHRQLARWAKSASLRSRQREQRAALVSAARVLEDPRFGEGVELRATGDDDGAQRRPS